MKRHAQGLLFIGALSLAACAPLETRVTEPLETASTRADHEALANYYERKAKELTSKAEASRHQARVYGAFPYGSPKSTVTFAQHYNAVAARLEAEAQDSLGLAAEHRRHAGFAQQ
ncbi:MAG: hypothetical protein ACT4QB_22770 [Gammaproteobacteria bacterium]